MSCKFKQENIDFGPIGFKDDFESLLKNCNPGIIDYVDSLGSIVQSNPQRAIKYFTDEINNDVDCVDNYFKRALTKDLFFEDYFGALEDYNHSLELDSKFSFPYYRRGILKEYLLQFCSQDKFWKFRKFICQEKIDLINSTFEDIQENFFELRNKLTNYIFEDLDETKFQSQIKKISKGDIFSYLKMFFLVNIAEEQKLSYMGEFYIAQSAKDDLEEFLELETNQYYHLNAKSFIYWLDNRIQNRKKALDASEAYYYQENYSISLLSQIFQIDIFHFVAKFFWN